MQKIIKADEQTGGQNQVKNSFTFLDIPLEKYRILEVLDHNIKFERSRNTFRDIFLQFLFFYVRDLSVFCDLIERSYKKALEFNRNKDK